MWQPTAGPSRTPGKMLSQVLEQMLEPYGALSRSRKISSSRDALPAGRDRLGFYQTYLQPVWVSHFVNTKSLTSSFPLALSPFFHRAPICTDTSRIEKDISQYWKVKNQIAPEASAYEFLQKGFTLDNLTAGARAYVPRQRPRDVRHQKRYLRFRRPALQPYPAHPRTAYMRSFPRPAISQNLSPISRPRPPAFKQRLPISRLDPVLFFGKVLAVSGTDVQVLFDVDVGGSGAGCAGFPTAISSTTTSRMPDIGATVFCYYENEGSAICLAANI